MHNVTLAELKDHIEAALKWASEMSDVWTGTLMGRMIDKEKTILENAVKLEDWSKAADSMIELVQMCDTAEETMKEQND